MSALTGPFPKTSKGANPRLRIFTLLVKAATTIYQGAAVGVDPATGYAEPMNGTNNALVAYGIADFTANGDGTNGLPTEVTVRAGVYPMNASGLAFTDLNKPAYATSDQDISTDSNGGARPVTGTIDAVESATLAWVAIEPPSAGVSIATANIAANIALQKRTVTIGQADLTDAVNGEAQTINVGAALPANAVVLAHEVNIATLFSGGSASAVKMDLGGTDADAIISQLDVFTGAATGALSPRTGVHAQGKFSAQQLVATFTPDGGHTLLGLTAGSLTITVWFTVLA